MTLVVAVTGPESIWLVADRRLSAIGRAPRDNACKVMTLESTDGVALLGYAGLGATVHGTEPSDWMSAVLRGRNLPLEQSLGVLAQALQRQFPRHLRGDEGHQIIAPAFVGNLPRVYVVDVIISPDRKRVGFRGGRLENEKPPKTPRVVLGGSGAAHLIKNQGALRFLDRLIRAHDRGKVSARAVADYLAKMNHSVHRLHKTVGPSCIVTWRFRKDGVHKGGGGHSFYSGTTADASSPAIPTIATGIDVRSIVGLLWPHMEKTMEAMKKNEPPPEPNQEEINEALARLPHGPDEDLR